MNHQQRRQRRQQIARAVQAGGTPPEMARRFGMSRASIYAACAEFGVKIDAKKGRFKPSTFAVIGLLVNTRLSLPAIAERQGLSLQRVCRIAQQCQEHGIRLRRRPQGRAH